MGYRSASQSEGLADVLERILDKGIVIAGDISVSLVGIELLTIRLRLLIATVDKAREMGIDWWSNDPYLMGRNDLVSQNETLQTRLTELEAQIARLGGTTAAQAVTDIPETSEILEIPQPLFRRHKEAP